MGIPSYFSHIVKNHRNIIKEYNTRMAIQNLYLDCNSLIYEAAHNTEYKKSNIDNIIIKKVCEKLVYYINLIKPSNKVFIAFDGVAPVAKLEQQRNRRYKSGFQEEIIYDLSNKESIKQWDTISITPGTNFMNKLVKDINIYFKNVKKFNVNEIIISNSDIAGEGEHKIYKYIRENPEYHKNTKTIIYGLDADLIMLTLNHLHIAKELYLFRETPEFIKSLDKSLNPNSNYILDIPEFGNKLSLELNNNNIPSTNQEKNKVFDYILLCFLLGNDFLPHFPALNIRTNGITILTDVYNNEIGNKNKNLTNGTKIIWKNLRKIINELSLNEHTYIMEEYSIRKKWRRNLNRQTNTPEDELNMIPIIDNSVELYINPNEKGWEERYYKELFDIRIDEEKKKEICLNYLQGLEWTLKYYTEGCIDWRWKYHYNYPPLLVDLIKYMPYFETNLLEKKEKNPVSSLTQLAYVLPGNKLNYLPNNLHKIIREKHPEWHGLNYSFKWAFCKYFWESHEVMPEIDVNELEDIVSSIKIT